LSSAGASSARENDGLADSDSIRWSTVIGPAGLEKLAEEADRSFLRPRRLEHHLLWLSRTDHGKHSTCGAIAFYREDTLVGYVPLRVRHSKLRLRIGEVTVVHLPFRASQLYGQGIVGEMADAAQIFTAVAEIPLAYDGIMLEEIPTESELWRELKRSKVFLVFRQSLATHYVIDLPSNYANYFQQLSQKTRTNIRRGARELDARLGGWEVRTFTAPEQIPELVQFVESIVTKTFHYHLLRQDLTMSNYQFVHNLTSYARQGWLRGYVLVRGRRAVAYSIGYVVNKNYQYELIGYDPTFAHASPGIVLLAYIIEDLIGAGIVDVLDFGAGEAGYKRLFGNRSYEEGAALICRRTLYASSAATAERVFAQLSALGTRIVRRVGLNIRLKKFLRGKRGPLS
jgi:CelD/BcsL family acetyltransferase involved in cellulose biosynthesis